jgi:hypothetical protein
MLNNKLLEEALDKMIEAGFRVRFLVMRSYLEVFYANMDHSRLESVKAVYKRILQ